MAKMRVHEVAKQLNKTSKELIAALRQSGIEVQSHMSTVTEEQVSKIREKLAKKDQPGEAPEPAKTPASQPAPEAKAPVKTPAPAREKAAPAKDSSSASLLIRSSFHRPPAYGACVRSCCGSGRLWPCRALWLRR